MKNKIIYGFGRIYQKDDRDLNYPLRKLIVKISEKTEQYWDAGPEGILDQDGAPRCVGYGWASWVDDPPVTHSQLIDPNWIYTEAQKIDGIPIPHDGTTVRAGVQVLQNNNYVTNYYWAASADEIVQAVLELGPVTVGTNWYDGMMTPDENGIIKPTGGIAGGHCYLIDGVNTITGLFRIKNSWGSSWGKQGFAFISIADLGGLLTIQGEGCLATEHQDPIPPPTPQPPVPVCKYARFISKIPYIGWPLVRGYRRVRKALFGIEPGNP